MDRKYELFNKHSGKKWEKEFPLDFVSEEEGKYYFNRFIFVENDYVVEDVDLDIWEVRLID